MFEPKTDPTRFYILTPLPKGQSGVDAIHCQGMVIGIGRVELPPYLDTQKIVTLNSTDEVTISEFNRWAEPLEQGFVRVLALNVEQLTGIREIETFPWVQRSNNDLELFTSVQSFEALPDGRVELRVSWRITTGCAAEVLSSGNSVFSVRSDGSYPSIVTAMSMALGQYSEVVAQGLVKAAKEKLQRELSKAREKAQAADAEKGEPTQSEQVSQAPSDSTGDESVLGNDSVQ